MWQPKIAFQVKARAQASKNTEFWHTIVDIAIGLLYLIKLNLRVNLKQMNACLTLTSFNWVHLI